MKVPSIQTIYVNSLLDIPGTRSIRAVNAPDVPRRRHFIRIDVDGRNYFIKRLSGAHRSVRTRNVEGEILGYLLLCAVGLPALKPSVIFTGHNKRWYVATKRLRNSRRRLRVFPLLDDPLLLNEVNDFWLGKLCCMDLIMGNADRSTANLIVLRSAKRFSLIPIDHDSAFLSASRLEGGFDLAGFVEGYEGPTDRCDLSRYKRAQRRHCGSIEHILGSTPVYWRFRNVARAPDSASSLRAAARSIVSALCDRTIRNVIGAVPSAVIKDDASRRLREVAEILRARRDGLFFALDHYRFGDAT